MQPEEWNSEKYPVLAGYPPRDVQEHCVRHEGWQACRRSMKGVPTKDKLFILECWWDRHQNTPYATEVQVGNYLGALRRGGQLDEHNRIRKYI